jgi:integrase
MQATTLEAPKAKTARPRKPKGSASAVDNHGSLWLYCTFRGNRYNIPTGLPFNETNKNLKLKTVGKDIERDIVLGTFDITLVKYRELANLAPKGSASAAKQLKLDELWDRFVIFKSKSCSENTMDTMYGQYGRYVKRLPTQDLSKATEMRDWVIESIPSNSAKRFIVRINACCEWGMDSGLIENNPFQRLVKTVKVSKTERKTEDDDIQPFTASEKDAILEAFLLDKFKLKKSAFTHSYYFPFVAFCFMTGCRPNSEAVALRWENISADCSSIVFEAAVIDTNEGRKRRSGLKTQAQRTFPCPKSLQTLLQAHKAKADSQGSGKPSDLVFPGHKGDFLDPDALRKGAWTQVLQGLGLKARGLYQTRHTFITQMLKRNASVQDVAKWVGNSPEVIYRHYAGYTRDCVVPEF